MDQLSGAHAHHDICCGGVGTKIPTILSFDSFGDESLLSLAGEVHYVGKVEVEFLSVYFDRDSQILGDSRRSQVSIAPSYLDITLTVATPYGLSVPSHIDYMVRDLKTPYNPMVLD